MYLYVCMQYLIRKKDIFINIWFLLSFEVYFYGLTMPMKKNLCLTRSQRKNKSIHLEQNAPIKRARLLVMKKKSYYGGILEDNETLKKEKLHWKIQQNLPQKREMQQKHARYVSKFHEEYLFLITLTICCMMIKFIRICRGSSSDTTANKINPYYLIG